MLRGSPWPKGKEECVGARAESEVATVGTKNERTVIGRVSWRHLKNPFEPTCVLLPDPDLPILGQHGDVFSITGETGLNQRRAEPVQLVNFGAEVQVPHRRNAPLILGASLTASEAPSGLNANPVMVWPLGNWSSGRLEATSQIIVLPTPLAARIAESGWKATLNASNSTPR